MHVWHHLRRAGGLQFAANCRSSKIAIGSITFPKTVRPINQNARRGLNEISNQAADSFPCQDWLGGSVIDSTLQHPTHAGGENTVRSGGSIVAIEGGSAIGDGLGQGPGLRCLWETAEHAINLGGVKTKRAYHRLGGGGVNKKGPFPSLGCFEWRGICQALFLHCASWCLWSSAWSMWEENLANSNLDDVGHKARDNA